MTAYKVLVDENSHFIDRKSTRLNSSHLVISYAVFCLKKKNHLARPRSAEGYDHQDHHLRAVHRRGDWGHLSRATAHSCSMNPISIFENMILSPAEPR